MIPNLNIEVWDKDGSLSDGFSSDDILGSVKIDLFDYEYIKKRKNLEQKLKNIEEDISQAVKDGNS